MSFLRSIRPLLADETGASLRRDVLGPWFPACIDESGGFHENFSHNWTKLPDQGRSLVFQSRMTWLSSALVNADYPDSKRFAKYAEHGLRFLADRMSGSGDGAFLSAIDVHGAPIGHARNERNAYSLAFALFALSAAARALCSDKALDLAKRLFAYIEMAHRDTQGVGYFDLSDMHGRPMFSDEASARGALLYKSQNPHLHLLEAFTELYAVWPDPAVRSSLESICSLFLNEFFSEKGSLHGLLRHNGAPVDGDSNYGHDLEVAHLLLAADKTLVDAKISALTSKAQQLVDHSLAHGWDNAYGGFFAFGNGSEITLPTKIWWVQAEGLVALAKMAEITRDKRYLDACESLWKWIRESQIDQLHCGWIDAVTAEGVEIGSGRKGHEWKAAYHDGRATLILGA